MCMLQLLSRKIKKKGVYDTRKAIMYETLIGY